MDIAIDACSVINLCNANCIEMVSECENLELWVGPIVLGECGAGSASKLLDLINVGKIRKLDDSNFSAERYLELLSQYNLGPGETECITAAETTGYTVCTDDGRARTVVHNLLGSDRLIGSAGLLRQSVVFNVIRCGDANRMFEQMKLEGGFLPKLKESFFCQL
ncbi:MAG: hypothetical protein RIM72_14215 [Alphaproteobacteria bacterium]